MRRRAYRPKNVGLVAPSSRKRSQSGSSPRSPLFGREEALRGGVGADDERDVAEAGEDLRPRRRQRGDARRARRVRRRHLRAVPSERLRERGARDVAGVAVAHRVGARDELDVGPRHARVGERGLRRDDAVLDEVAAPLAPRVHARAEDRDVVFAHGLLLSGAHCQIDVLVLVVLVERAEHQLHLHADLELRGVGARSPARRAPPSSRRRARPRTRCTARTGRATRTAPAARSGSSSTTTASRCATARPARGLRPVRSGCPRPRPRSARSTNPTRRRGRRAAPARDSSVVNQFSTAGTLVLLTSALPGASTSVPPRS